MNNKKKKRGCTIQRVESINAAFKEKMSLKSSLENVLNFVKNREFRITSKQMEESYEALKKVISKSLDELNIVQYFKKWICPYVLEKIKYQFLLSLNYQITISDTNIDGEDFW